VLNRKQSLKTQICLIASSVIAYLTKNFTDFIILLGELLPYLLLGF